MYYDSYFHSLINNTNSIISIQNSILLYLQVLVFLVSLFFIYVFLNNSLERRG